MSAQRGTAIVVCARSRAVGNGVGVGGTPGRLVDASEPFPVAAGTAAAGPADATAGGAAASTVRVIGSLRFTTSFFSAVSKTSKETGGMTSFPGSAGTTTKSHSALVPPFAAPRAGRVREEGG